MVNVALSSCISSHGNDVGITLVGKIDCWLDVGTGFAKLRFSPLQ